MTYAQLLKSIVKAHGQTQKHAITRTNQMLVLRNWLVGARLVEFDQSGRTRAGYGEQMLERLATDLKRREVAGLGISSLKNCRQFYLMYPQIRQSVVGEFWQLPEPGRIRQSLIGELPRDATVSDHGFGSGKSKLRQVSKRIRQPLSAELGVGSAPQPAPLSTELVLRFSWTKLAEFIRLDDPWKRTFYENECLQGNWSVRQLQRQIGSLLYERTGLSKDKQSVVRRAHSQEPQETIQELLRDPYVMEFTGLAERPEYSESELESALLNHLQSFLLELGAGFCFESRQKRITIANKHDYIDLVFYHRRLRCHVLLDLKIRHFRHADAGQMNFYLNWWKANAVEPGDNAPVGILLCSERDRTEVEFATAGMDNKLFVSRYLVALPTVEQLRRFVEADRARLDAVHR